MIGDRVFVVLHTFDEETHVYSVHATREGADAVVEEYEARKAAIEASARPAPGYCEEDTLQWATWILARQAAYDTAGMLLGAQLEVWGRGFNAPHDEPDGFLVQP